LTEENEAVLLDRRADPAASFDHPLVEGRTRCGPCPALAAVHVAWLGDVWRLAWNPPLSRTWFVADAVPASHPRLGARHTRLAADGADPGGREAGEDGPCRLAACDDRVVPGEIAVVAMVFGTVG
jgi:hypothetical protein